jgi:hypothetical protein
MMKRESKGMDSTGIGGGARRASMMSQEGVEFQRSHSFQGISDLEEISAMT